MSITTDCGWLSPAGKWHPCCEEEHKDMARDLLEQLEPGKWRGRDREHFGDPERELEKRGYVKLADEYGAHLGYGQTATPRQNKKLLEWCLGAGRGKTPLPRWLQADRLEQLRRGVR
jgi:hypothetical protein